jgi:hypothetical protein
MKKKIIKITEIFSKKKEIKPICGNCRLFDSKENVCKVIVLHEGEKINVPVEKSDNCFFENEFLAINEEGQKESFKPEVQQVKFWVEDEKGEKTKGDGTVKIEYPDGFFGDETNQA